MDETESVCRASREARHVRACIVAGFFCALVFTTAAEAQISAGGVPKSFEAVSRLGAAPTVTLSAPANSDLIAAADAEWKEASEKGDQIPWQVAEPMPVSLNLKNSGEWRTLPDGTRIWRLRIHSPGAQSLYFVYDRWILPKGADLFIYSDDRSEVIGSFTSANNWIDSTNMTAPMNGNAMTLEYSLTPEAEAVGELSISTVLHGFRGFDRTPESPLDSYNDAGICHVDVNCPEGAPWQQQKRAVALVFTPTGGSCSGALINNTRNDGRPYFLTANHCWAGSGSNWVFRFNYESPGCFSQDGPYNQTVSNAYGQAWQDISDFLLLEFSTPPPISYNPWFAGWNRDGAGATSTFGIHHPKADIKKISVDNLGPYHADWNGSYDGHYWGVHWDVGRVEPGSSGSPLFSENGLIIGQLRGGYSECPAEDEPDFYGKFSTSWGWVADPAQRLLDYLDPIGTGQTILVGHQPVQPINDLCSSPVWITTLPYYTTGNTRYATVDYTNCTGHSSNDVWYVVQLPCQTNVTINTCGSTFDTELRVGTGACGALVPVACNDDGPDCPVDETYGDSEVQFLAQANVPYFIQLSGYGANSGNFYLNVTGTSTSVPNDVCPGTYVTDFPFHDSGNTQCAQNQYVDGTCGYENGSPDVVYTIIPPCNTYADFSTCGSDFDTQISMYDVAYPGNCGGAGTAAGCNDDGGICIFNPTASYFNTYLYANHIYRLTLQGYNGAAGNFELRITPTVAGNTCSNTAAINSLPYTANWDTRCASSEYDNCVDFGAAEMIYTYTPATCHVCRVSLCGSGYDTSLRVFTGGSCPGTSQIACNDDYCDLQSRLDFNATAGQTYWIIVSGYNLYEGPYTLNVTNVGTWEPPANSCVTAPLITALPYSSSGSTICAGYTYFHCGGAGGGDVIYKLNLPECTYVTASLCGSDYDTMLDIRTGVSCGGTNLVNCVDDGYCDDVYTLQSTVVWAAEAGVEYYLLIHGYNGAIGNYVLTVEGEPCVLPAPTEATAAFNFDTGEITLSWAEVPGAEYYSIYASPLYETLYAPENVINDVVGTSFTFCCLADFGEQHFFGVTAYNAGALELLPIDPARLPDSEPKESAAQSPLAIDWNQLNESIQIENEELAPPDKELTASSGQ